MEVSVLGAPTPTHSPKTVRMCESANGCLSVCAFDWQLVQNATCLCPETAGKGSSKTLSAGVAAEENVWMLIVQFARLYFYSW